jgi:hypothetical protein
MPRKVVAWMRGVAVIGVVGALALAVVPAAVAQPASGPRETVDESFSTTQPTRPTDLSFTGTYHAADDPKGDPPYMRRMEFVPPAGMRLDTTVPAACTATDVQLEAFGPKACPAGSVIGSGTTDGVFFEPVAHSFVIDRFHHTVDVVNAPGQQIMLVHSEGYTVVRGRVAPDGTTDFAGPTCFPAPPAGGCLDDYVLQVGSSVSIPAYTRGMRSYATTPPTCPDAGSWETTVRFWWADGTADDVVSRQPCSA